jgi:hypothetical protein
MSKDYIDSQRASFINRGESDSPVNVAKHFGKQDAERRAKILDAISNEDDNGPIEIEDARKHLERRSYVNMIKRTHKALRGQGR